VAGDIWLRADLEQDGREILAGIDEQAGEDDAVGVGGGHGGCAVGGAQRGEAEAEDDGVGVGDADGLSEVVDAGVRRRFLPASSCALMVAAVSVPGWAM
jgi:hypothetical protein